MSTPDRWRSDAAKSALFHPVDPHAIPRDRVMRSMELLGERVIPALSKRVRGRPPALLQSAVGTAAGER